MFIKLPNGQQIKLEDLDKLENKSTSGLSKFFDNFKMNGNNNNVFDKHEIEKLKSFLIEIANDDNAISKQELQNATLKYQSVFENYSVSSFESDLSMLSFQNSKQTGNNTYTVQSGDTVDKIVANLGYTKEDAQIYKKALVKKLTENNSFMNNKGWLKADTTIELLSEDEIQSLNIKKAKPNKQQVKLSEKTQTGQNPPEQNPTYYKVKSGDTLKSIIAKLGYTGEDAKKYEKALDEQLEADKSYMNDKKWLLTDSKIRLLSDKKLEELGIKKAPKVENSKEPSTSKTPENRKETPAVSGQQQPDIVKTQPSKETPTNKNIGGAKLSDQKEPINTSTIQEIKHTPEQIKKQIQSAGHKSRTISAVELNDEQKKAYDHIKRIYNSPITLIKNETTNEVHIYCDATNSKNGQKTNLKSIEIIIDGDRQNKPYPQDTDKTIIGERKVKRYHSDGKIVIGSEIDLQYKKDGKIKTDTITNNKLLQSPPKEPETKKVIMEALPINIKVSPEVYAKANESQKKDIDEFVNTLETQKAELMKDLNLSNDEYNQFAHMALGIAMQESGFGTGKNYNYVDKQGYYRVIEDSVGVANKYINQFFDTDYSTSGSKGLTQIKLGDWSKDKKIKKLFDKYGVNYSTYSQPTAEDSAIATMIVLKEVSKKAKSQKVQDGIEMANDRIYYSPSLPDKYGNFHKQEGYIVNKVTEQDAMLYIYNGATGRLTRGDATPAIRDYNVGVKKYQKLFTIEEDQALREKALEKAPTIIEGGSKEQNKPMKKDLGWGIGQVAFMPKLYTGGVTQNTKSEISNVKEILIAKGIDGNKINQLIQKLENGELTFVNGLSNDEIKTITKEDVDMLLNYSEKLKQELSTIKSNKQKRELAMKADKRFKNDYLASHARQVHLENVKNKTVLLNDLENKDVIQYPKQGYNTGAQKRCKKYLKQLRGKHSVGTGPANAERRIAEGKYTGFKAENDKGININNTTPIDLLLAQNGADSTNTLKTGGACLTGTKQSLIGAGAVKAEEMTTFNNASQLALFLEKHPERFQEVEYIQISDTVAREITAADIANLPAGYIVVYGNANRLDVPGHAGITSGNGQIYADEADNSNWDNFVANSKNQNGKGEHGYVRVFRLNPNYFKIVNGQLVKA